MNCPNIGLLNIYKCMDCQTENEMPYDYCCLIECGEHEFCKGCLSGVYLKLKTKK